MSHTPQQPPVGHTENGYIWTGARWVPVEPAPGTVDPQQPSVPLGQQPAVGQFPPSANPPVKERKKGGCLKIGGIGLALVVVLFFVLPAIFGGGGGSEAPQASSTGAPAADTRVAPAEFPAITGREFSDVAANPENHVDRAMTIYGKVTQFDSRTGPTAMRADTGGERANPESVSAYVTYPSNSILEAPESVLAGLVADDIFKAHVVVTGSRDYESTANFKMTVPTFEVFAIELIGGSNAPVLTGTKATPLQIGALTYTVSETQRTKTLKSSYDSTSGDFLVISVNLRNDSSKAFTVDSGDFNLVESDGTEYRPLESSYRWIDDDFSYETINPKSAQDGRIIFEYPSDVPLSDLSLQVSDGVQQGLISLND